ncbi:MAG TPA: HAD-IIB family hydrolase [Candidatus Paceibacterota bacterium]|nr:HAD-IIB family hydrolase [Candidatus Paceibacterota bacterium]
MPDCIIFDLDTTLAKSKQPIDAAMAHTLAALLTKARVAVASGGKCDQLQTQVADRLPPHAPLERLYLLPTSGAALYVYENGVWKQVYEEALSQDEANTIERAMHQANEQVHVIDFSEPAYGERIEFRGAEVSLSVLGQKAPIEAKQKWDPGRTKREALRAALAPLLPNYEVRIGGTTTIDVTKKGIDKAYGVHRLAEYLSIPIAHMLYVGDELRPGGNDEVVIATGIPTHAVTDPDDTKQFIESLLKHA